MHEASESKSTVEADEIVPLTSLAVRDPLQSRRESPYDEELARRQVLRWPFPGAVEIWLPTAGNREEHVLATLHDLSEQGMGVRSDIALEPGKVYAVAVHQPEVFYPLHAFVCERCFLVQLGIDVDPSELFGGVYHYYSSYSESWLDHSRRHVEGTIDRFGNLVG